MLSPDRTRIFFLQMAYQGGLAALATLFFTGDLEVRDNVGTIPIAVPWFGALGGALISLKGVFDHPYDWDPGHRLWHVSRPFVSATLAVIAVLMFQSGILAVGSDVNPDETDTATTATNLFYYLIAFLVGYREETFRELIKRLVDVLLAPGGPGGVAPVISELAPASGPTAGGTQVTIVGSGFAGTRSIKFGSDDANFTFHNDSRLVAVAPQADEPGTVSVTVSGPGGSATSSYAYQGTAPALPAEN